MVFFCTALILYNISSMQVASIIHEYLTCMYRNADCYRFSTDRTVGLLGAYYNSLYSNLYNSKIKENVQSVYCWNVVDKLTTILYMLCKLHHQHHLYVYVQTKET